MNARIFTMGLLVVSGILLSSLIPGGPIEDRNFTQIHPLVLGAFNLFLTVLGLGSLWLAFAMRHRAISPLWPALAGMAYIAVYGLDLMEIFPFSPTPMSLALWSIEVTGLILAVPLVLMSVCNGSRTTPVTDKAGFSLTPARGMLVLLGIGIVSAATCAAMGVCH